MSSDKLEKGIFKITAGIVFVFTVLLSFNLLSFRPSLKDFILSSRAPAALASESKSLSGKLSASNELEQILPCLENGGAYKFTAPTQRLRIEATLCKAKSEINNSKIINKANGFVATVFKLSATEFTTDLIDLQPGNNAIKVAHTLANGEVISANIFVNYELPQELAAEVVN